MKKLGLTKNIIVLYIISFLIIVIGDQYTKYVIAQKMPLGSSYTIIDNFFYFTYVHNSGAAWGILQGKLNVFFIISIVAAIAIVYYFIKSQSYQKLMRYGLVLMFSGMLGNLIDRIMFSYVRDFIDFIILGYNFPVFNIADMAIVVGVGLLLFEFGVEEYKVWKLSKSQ